jgi:hypothetical protein
VRKRHFLSTLYIKKWSFYQDMLGTNMGKAQVKKECRFVAASPQARTAASASRTNATSASAQDSLVLDRLAAAPAPA